MAQIIYRWKREDPEEYANFLKEAWGVQQISAALDRRAT